MADQNRQIARIIEPQPVVEGAGVRLKRSIAGAALDYLDPFLLFDHFGSDNPRDYLPGFPMHPHRGIETVTYMLAGAVTHRDSLGNAGTIGAGDVQWMTAGRGIMHEEMPEPVDGRMAGFQLWVNLPARLKMTQPRYQEILSAALPEVRRDDGAVVRVIAGSVGDVRGPVTDIFAEPEYLDVTLPADASFEQPVTRGHNAFAYVFEGGGNVRGWHGGARQPENGHPGRWGRRARPGRRRRAQVPARLRRAARRADRPLWPLRHEHARGDPAGAGGPARRDVRASLGFDTIDPATRAFHCRGGIYRAVGRLIRRAVYARLLRRARVCSMALLFDRRWYSGLSTATKRNLALFIEVQTPAIGLRQRRSAHTGERF